MKNIRLLSTNIKLPVEIILPSSALRGHVIHSINDKEIFHIPQKFQEPINSPIVLLSPPCAGTNRFIPPISEILGIYGWKTKYVTPLNNNSHYLSLHPGIPSKIQSLCNEEFDARMASDASEALYWSVRALDRWEYTCIHDIYMDAPRLSDVGGPVIVLMRDPRDIINSYYFRYFTSDYFRHASDLSDKDIIRYENHDEIYEDGLLSLINGERCMTTYSYYSRWLSAKHWVKFYLSVLDRPNFHIVRFEDLHRDPVGTYRRLLADIGLDPNPFVALDDQTLNEAIKLGTFEYQTGGMASRGQESREVVRLPNGQTTSCRKGVVGDWRNNFTPRVVERFKELTGDALVKLGYEKDMNWAL